MKHFLPTLLLLFSVNIFAQNSTEKIHKIKILFNQSQDLQRLASIDIPVDHGRHKKDHFFISEYSTSEIETIKEYGFQVEILTEDVIGKFHAENARSMEPLPTRNATSCVNTANPLTYPTPANFNQGSMGGYLTYQEILNEMDDMFDQYPNIISERAPISDFRTEGQPNDAVTPSIGDNPIYWMRISDNPNTDEDEAEILYNSIHHAREPMAVMQNIYYMWYLLENYETDPEIKALVDNTEMYFVPIVNPDGYLHNEFTDPNGGGFWRKNRLGGFGVDNNRNYDYHIDGDASNGSWSGPGSSSSSGSDIYHGSAPFSEVENQAMKWFVENHNFVMAFNSHTSGNLLYYPFSYADVATPDDALFQTIGAELTSQNNYFALRDTPFSGDSDDFMYGTVGTHNKIFSFTPEIGVSFWQPANTIDATCKEMMFQNLTAAKMAISYGTLTFDTDVLIGDNNTVTINFNLRNLSLTEDQDFTVRLNPISSNISNPGSTVSFNNMDTLEEDSGSITYTLDSGIAPGEEVVFELIVNNEMYDNAFSVTQVFGETVQAFFANGDSTTVGFDSNDWTTTTSTSNSAPSSITDGDGNYASNTDKAIQISNPIDLTTALGAGVSFYTRWDIEDLFDYVQFEISTDGGSTWEAQCGKFTTRGGEDQAEDEPIYDGLQTQWVKEEINLSDYIGETILARFRLVTDNGNNRDGFYFDDLEFKVINDPSLSVDDAFAKTFAAYPNPVRDMLHLITQTTNYTATIYNIQGQRVSEQTELDGNTQLDYSQYPSGIYFVQLQSADKKATIKVIKK